MFVKKWIIAEQPEDIRDLTGIIITNDINICWCPRSEDDFYNKVNFHFFQTWQYNKIAIGFQNFSQIQNPQLFYNTIIRFFFQIAYFKEQKNPCIFHFVSETENINKIFLEFLEKNCLQQGFSNLIIYQYIWCAHQDKIVFFSEPNVIGINNYKIFLDKWIDQIIDLKNVKEAFIFIPFEETSITKKIIFDLQTEEIGLINNKIYQIADLLVQNNKVVDANKIFLKELKEDGSNKSLYLETQKNNFIEIMKWYHNEYEILPLWYKRFGHIIKVIMGKRSFRSLFSDNVKKYKD